MPTNKKISLLEENLASREDEYSFMLNNAVLGDLYSVIEMYDKAYEFYAEALKIAQEKNLEIYIGDYYQDLGGIQLRIGDLESSLDFYTKAYEILKNTSETKRKKSALGNIAVLQSRIGPIEKSIITLNKLNNDEDLDQIFKANTLMTLGNIYLEKLKIPEKAIHYYNKALELLKSSPHKKIEVMLLQNIAEAEIELNNYDEALYYNKRSDVVLKQMPSLELRASLHKFYTIIYQEKKQYKDAYTHLDLQHKYNDSLAKTITQLKIANINTINELDKYETDINLQKSKVESLEKEKMIDRLKLVILLISFVVLVLITYILVKRSRYSIEVLKNEKLEITDKLNFNKNKIEKMALNIATSQEYVSSLSEKIKATLTKITDPKSKDEINKLLIDLQSYKVVSNNKKELNTYLEKINSEYLFNLTNNYPDLTKEEQHLCSLIYLDLKNKDISNLLNLSVRSIENRRYRIRKKMNLKTNQNLSDVLNDLNIRG